MTTMSGNTLSQLRLIKTWQWQQDVSTKCRINDSSNTIKISIAPFDKVFMAVNKKLVKKIVDELQSVLPGR